MDDIDVAGRLSRDVFEEKSASVLERARAPLQKVMLAAHIASLPEFFMNGKVAFATALQHLMQRVMFDKSNFRPSKPSACCTGFGRRPDISHRCAHSRGGWWQLQGACTAEDHQRLLWQGTWPNSECQGVCVQGCSPQLCYAQPHFQVSYSLHIPCSRLLHNFCK